MMPKSIAALPALLALLLATSEGCESGGSETSTPVGEILDVWALSASVNGTDAFDGKSLVALDDVSTNATGVVDFKLTQKFQECNVDTSSTVEIHPESGALLRLTVGTTWCSTTAGGDAAVILALGVKITASDPVFGVTVEPEQVTVHVAQGIVAVELAEGGDVVRLVGPGQRVVVPPDAGPGPVERFALEELVQFERLRLGDLVGAVRPPSFARPEPGDSSTLARIAEQGQLTVAIDEEALAGGGEGAFLEAFGAFWAESWEVRPAMSATSLDEAFAALEAGAADLVVTPRPPDAGSLPFFEDEAGRLWHVVVDPQDAAFEQAVRDFLRTTLEAGRYGEIYERAFGRMAPYDRLADLAGL